MPQSDGKPLRDHLQALEKRGRKRQQRLHKQAPAELLYVWRDYCDLRSSTKPGRRIPFAEFDAAARLLGKSWTPSEVRLLRALDNVYMRAFIEAAG